MSESIASVKTRLSGLREEIRRHVRLYYKEAEREISDGDYDRLSKELQDLEARYPELVTEDSPTQMYDGKPSPALIKVRFRKLRDRIRRHDRLYYEKAAPKISDAEYDDLFKDLQDFEARYPEMITKNSPTQKVGGKPSSMFAPVRHLSPMLSLANVFNGNEARAFDARIRKELAADAVFYVAEPKLDGVALNLIYRKGRLEIGATRGDGTVGDDITASVRMIKTVPKTLRTDSPPAVLEVRGEVIIHTAAFDRMNEKLSGLGLKPFVNPRNAVAGTLRNLVTRIVEDRPLSFYAYGVGAAEGIEFASHSKTLSWLGKAGFKVSPKRARKKGIDRLIAFHDAMSAGRADFPFAIDGVVYKVDDTKMQRELGLVSRAPRYAAAHKFDPQEAETTLERIDIQIGRTGVLTPVARLKKIFVGGVEVSNATLHNESEIRRRNIKVPCRVRIRRAGDVIPEVVEAIEHSSDAKDYVFPDKCPSCGGAVESAEAESGPVIRYCRNLDCPAQVCRRLIHYASRLGFDIQGIDRKIAETLVSEGLAKSPADLYRLRSEDLRGLPMFAEQSADKLIRHISETRTAPLARYIYALGIPSVGESKALYIAQFFGGLGRFREASLEELLFVEDFGVETARAVRGWWESDRNSSMVDDLESLGVRPEDWKDAVRLHIGVKRLSEIVAKMKLLPKEEEEEGLLPGIGEDPLSGISDSLFEHAEGEFESVAEMIACPDREIVRRLGKYNDAAARSLVDFLRSKRYGALIERLRERGVDFGAAPVPEDAPLAGRTYVVTGTLSGISRNEAKAHLRKLGAKIAATISGSTDCVVMGDKPGKKKMEALEKFGTEVIDEQDLLDLIADARQGKRGTDAAVS